MLDGDPARVLSGTNPFPGLVSSRKYPNVSRSRRSSAPSPSTVRAPPATSFPSGVRTASWSCRATPGPARRLRRGSRGRATWRAPDRFQTRPGADDAIAEEQVIARPAHGSELRPGCRRDVECGALDERQPVPGLVAAGELGRDGEEQLVEESRAQQVADEVGTSLAQDQASTGRRRERPPAASRAPARCYRRPRSGRSAPDARAGGARRRRRSWRRSPAHRAPRGRGAQDRAIRSPSRRSWSAGSSRCPSACATWRRARPIRDPRAGASTRGSAPLERCPPPRARRRPSPGAGP